MTQTERFKDIGVRIRELNSTFNVTQCEFRKVGKLRLCFNPAAETSTCLMVSCPFTQKPVPAEEGEE